MIGVYLAASGAAVLWGASFLLTKIILTQMGPMAAAALRWGAAALVLVAATVVTTRGRMALRNALQQDGWTFAGLGLVGVGMFYTLQNLALVYTTSVDVGLIMSGVPVFSAVLGAWLLREQLTGHVVGGMVMAIVGVTLISLGGLGEARTAIGTQLWGDLLALLTTLCGAVYIVGGKRVVTEYNPLIVTTLAGTMGAVALLPVAVLEGLTLRLSAGVWVALLGLALGSGAAANWLWWYAANRLPVSRAGAFLYVTPVVSTALGIGILGEPLTLATVAGAGFVIGGVVFVQA